MPKVNVIITNIALLFESAIAPCKKILQVLACAYTKINDALTESSQDLNIKSLLTEFEILKQTHLDEFERDIRLETAITIIQVDKKTYINQGAII